MTSSDWDRIQRRYADWWGPDRRGPLVQIDCPSKKGKAGGKIPAWARGGGGGQWTVQMLLARDEDEDRRLGELSDLYASQVDRSVFFGDRFPSVLPHMGYGVLAAFLSGHLKFDGDTVWFGLPDPMCWDDIIALELKDDAAWWVGAKKATRRLVRDANGRYVVGHVDLGGVMDVLASLRTTEQLLEDIIVEPELVSRASLHILKLWHESYDELSSIMTSEGQTGTSSWVSPYSPGRWYPVQCEFAAMLSKKQFDRFVIPLIIAQSECLDHTLYYLDGAEHLPHLDLLLGVEKLGGIAWCSGPGQPGMNDPYWRPFYDKVQRAGKRQVINGIGARDIQSFLEGMSSEGVLVDTSCESEEEAAELEGALKLKS